MIASQACASMARAAIKATPTQKQKYAVYHATTRHRVSTVRAQNALSMKVTNGVQIWQKYVLQTYASMASAASIAIWTQKDKTIMMMSILVVFVATTMSNPTVPVHHANVTLIAMIRTAIASMIGAPTYYQTYANTSRACTVTAHHARLITNASENFASMASAAM